MAGAATTVTSRGPGLEKAGHVTAGRAWLILGLTLALLLSDYMSRQVLSAVFPLLKVDWRLTDTQLGTLGGIVPLAVGILTFPLSLIADRVGRVRSIAAMAILWSLATLGCGLAARYDQMLWARVIVGVGEAAYGSVGCAVVVSAFPPSLRATIVAMFTAGGVFGSVLGLAAGGAIAQALDWRWAFAVFGLIGLVLGMIYPLAVRDPAARPAAERRPLFVGGIRGFGLTLVPARSSAWTYLACGLSLFTPAALMSWTPSFLNRYYALAPAKASALAALFVLGGGVGMIVCGALADWVSKRFARRQLTMAGIYSLVSAGALLIALRLPAGSAQLALLATAIALASGSLGPAGAFLAARTRAAAHGTVFAAFTLVNNALGLAPGPLVTGMAADRMGLLGALQLAPIAGLIAAAAFIIGERSAASADRQESSEAP
jgi:MFS family permease